MFHELCGTEPFQCICNIIELYITEKKSSLWLSKPKKRKGNEDTLNVTTPRNGACNLTDQGCNAPRKIKIAKRKGKRCL